jgi:hypothetical protein
MTQDEMIAANAPTPTTPATAEQLREDAKFFRQRAQSIHGLMSANGGDDDYQQDIDSYQRAADALYAEAARMEADPERELREQRDKAREREIVLELALQVVANDCLDPRWQEHAETALAFTPEAPDAK